MTLELSKTFMGIYLRCPRSCYFRYYCEGVRTKTDYPRLLGTMVHRFVAGLYKEHKDKDNPFFYSSLEKAQNAWSYYWSRSLKDNKDILIFPDNNQAKRYGNIGVNCISRYWRQNENKPVPIGIETRLGFPIIGGVRFIGTFDQIRQTTPEVIAEFRPDLVVDGKLAEGIAPVFIVDLKTDEESFDLRDKKPRASLSEQAGYQSKLHEDLQVTSYYWLYYQSTGLLPAGFFWYHMRSGRWFYTYRTLRDFDIFLDQVRYVVEGLNSQRFIKIPDSCSNCDYSTECMVFDENRTPIVSRPVRGVDESTIPVQTGMRVIKARQRKMKLVTPRVKVEKPVLPDKMPDSDGTVLVVPNDQPVDDRAELPPNTEGE